MSTRRSFLPSALFLPSLFVVDAFALARTAPKSSTPNYIHSARSCSRCPQYKPFTARTLC